MIHQRHLWLELVYKYYTDTDTGVVQALFNANTLTGMLVFFFLLFQDLVTASIAIETGGLNYDLDIWGCASLQPTQVPSQGCLVFFLEYQCLVTASIALEPGGLNYDLDTTLDMGLLVHWGG